MRNKTASLILSILGLLISFSSCSKKENKEDDPEQPNSAYIETGSTVEAAAAVIPASGGNLKVAKPGSPIDGMEIVIQSNSFAKSQSVNVSYSDIKSHRFSKHFNPISPLITIAYDGGYSNEPMQITVPINLPDGHFAMAFYVDKTSGKLEGLPVLKLSSTSITVTTRHFMSGNDFSNNNSGLKSASANGSMANMIISSVSESALQNTTVINSGFTPGSDDWEFVNFGSYLEPAGHCAGQSITAMWYYYEKKMNGELALFHQFDNLNKKTEPSFMWQDNPLGYRFSSVIQSDLNFGNWVNNIAIQSFLPSLVFKAFATAMLVTGEPQFVLIRNSAGNGGHAMIVYKVNFKEGKLYIADPNYPNNREVANGVETIRTIEYSNGALKPYETGLSAGTESITMDQIGFFGKTAYIDWSQIGKRWEELKNKTIGNVAPNTFPNCKVFVDQIAAPSYELKDGAYVSKDTLFTSTVIPEATIGFNSANGRLTGSIVYDEKGTRIDTQYGATAPTLNLASRLYVTLKPGLNKLGYYIVGWKHNYKYSNGIYVNNFIDFRWINVNLIPLKINPNPLSSEPNKANKLTAATKGKAPKSTRYVWDFGDGSTPVTVQNDSTVDHTFLKEGRFTVKVELHDNSTNQKLVEATSIASIAKAREVVSLGSYTLNLLPVATNSGTVKVQHLSNKLIVSKTSGTLTHTAEISWLAPPGGNLEVSEGKLFMNQSLTFNFSKTSTTGSSSFPGCEIWMNDVNPATGWYNDWQQSNEATLGLTSPTMQKNIPATSGTNTASASMTMPVVMSLSNTGGPESGIDGTIEFSGVIRNFWAAGDNIPFKITYTYKD